MLAHSELADIAANVYRGPWSRTVARDVHYALLPRGGEVVVALPGTHPAEALDWIRDLSVWPVWARGLGLVHAGFGLGALAAWAEIAPILSRDKLVTFTGHSLGGALAIALAALHAVQRPGLRFRLVTFGAPRVAFLNPWLGHLLRRGGPHALFARRGDIVPLAPARPLYRHPAPLTRIGAATGEVLADHAIARYAADVRALERAAAFPQILTHCFPCAPAAQEASSATGTELT
jgi:hypothetical protein